MPLVDLSKLTKLKEVVFWYPEIQRITVTLQTAESINLEQIIIHSAPAFSMPIVESGYRKWQDLDRLLLQFWISRSIRPQIKFKSEKDGCDLRSAAPRLFPELTSRGIVDLVEYRRLE